MLNKWTFGIVLAVCLTGGVATGVSSYFNYQAAIIQQREETLRLQKREQEKTKRTGERSQFWQKLVPWGTDE